MIGVVFVGTCPNCNAFNRDAEPQNPQLSPFQPDISFPRPRCLRMVRQLVGSLQEAFCFTLSLLAASLVGAFALKLLSSPLHYMHFSTFFR